MVICAVCLKRHRKRLTILETDMKANWDNYSNTVHPVKAGDVYQETEEI